MKKEGDLTSKWTIGMVESVTKGRDDIIRKVVIKYCNSGEQKLSLHKGDGKDSTFPRYTERSVRRLIKIFSIEEASLAEDMAEFDRREKEFATDKPEDDTVHDVEPINDHDPLVAGRDVSQDEL